MSHPHGGQRMGIEQLCVRFLRAEVHRGVRLDRMLTLGRQTLYLDAGSYRLLAGELALPSTQPVHADAFFGALGAQSVDVFDASAYEGANIVHDLNRPVGDALRNRYDTVLDGGALEHVFNFPTALQSCLEMVRLGGHFITATPMNNYCGHGFYQFSPELYFSALTEANGYTLERALFADGDQWYAVCDPRAIGARVELINYRPTLLFVSARRTAIRPIFAQWPQQADYVASWEASAAGQVTVAEPVKGVGPFKEALLARSAWLRRAQTSWRGIKQRRICSPANRAWFKPVNLS